MLASLSVVGEESDDSAIQNRIGQLDSTDVVVCMRAINDLCDAGPRSAPAIEKLLKLATSHEKEYIQLNARRALAAIGNAALDAIFRDMAKLPEERNQFHSAGEEYAEILKGFRPDFRPKITEHLSDKNPAIVRACINALVDNWHCQWVTQPGSRPKIPEFLADLKGLFDHADGRVSKAAKSAVDEIENPRWRCIRIYR